MKQNKPDCSLWKWCIGHRKMVLQREAHSLKMWSCVVLKAQARQCLSHKSILGRSRGMPPPENVWFLNANLCNQALSDILLNLVIGKCTYFYEITFFYLLIKKIFDIQLIKRTRVIGETLLIMCPFYFYCKNTVVLQVCLQELKHFTWREAPMFIFFKWQ